MHDTAKKIRHSDPYMSRVHVYLVGLWFHVQFVLRQSELIQGSSIGI